MTILTKKTFGKNMTFDGGMTGGRANRFVYIALKSGWTKNTVLVGFFGLWGLILFFIASKTEV